MAQLVANLDGYSGNSSPGQFLDAGSGNAFFANMEYPSGIWKTDGTGAGTTRIADFNAGPYWDFEAVGQALFFVHNDGVHGLELWKTDGTAAGTKMLKDIYPGGGGSSPNDLTNVNGTLMFMAQDYGGYQLWKSDGTTEGTVNVTGERVVFGSTSDGHYLTNVNGTVFFHPDTKSNGQYGSQVWKSDGTKAGTVLVKDFAEAGNRFRGSFNNNFTNIGGQVFLRTMTATGGYNLWKTDGTGAGTVLLKSFPSGYRDGPMYITNVNGTAFFGADDGVWKSDGTPAGTVKLADVRIWTQGDNRLSNVNGTLFFVGDDGTHGDELWKSDGTVAGTVLVKDINTKPFNAKTLSSSAASLVNWNGTLLFYANDGVLGSELWMSDGTPAGTRMVADINPGSADGVVRQMTPIGNMLLLDARDGVHGGELWKVVDIPEQPPNAPPSGKDGTVRLIESASYTFQVADFGFSDAGSNPPHHFQAVKINTLPGGGSLKLNSTDVSAGQFVSAFDVASGRLRYVPVVDKSGSPYASFTFQVQDDGGTAGGGSDLAVSTSTITISVAPAIKVLEDVAYPFAPVDFGLSDGLAFVKILSLPAAGSLSLDSAAISAGQSVAAGDVAAGKLRFLAAANTNGAAYASFPFQLGESGGTSTININVTPVNDPPQGISSTVTILEDAWYSIRPQDFQYSDLNDQSPPSSVSPGYFKNVIITSLPTSGKLYYRGLVTPGQLPLTATLDDLYHNYLTFYPDPNANGAVYAQIGFQVQDSGGTANGGIDKDPLVKTLSINVTSVNDAPRGADETIATLEDTAYTLAASDFGFSDPGDTPANVLKAVRIVTPPERGVLKNGGIQVFAGNLVPAEDITGGKLQYVPPANANGAALDTFKFRVQDDGGRARGGRDMDATARTVTIDVTPVNDAPAGTDLAVNLVQNSAYLLAIADFGFADPADAPPASSTAADSLAAVIITAPPGAGTLSDHNGPVSAGQVIPAADIAAGRLRFVPATDATGSPYASFSFQVQDSGGTALGGKDLDLSPNTLTFRVVPPGANQEPTGADTTVTTLEDTAHTFTRGDFGFRDPSQTPPDNFNAVKITSRPPLGVVTNGGLPVIAGQFIPVADIDAGKLKFIPAGNAHGLAYTSFTVQVQDDGGVANDGKDIDSTPSTISIRVVH